jgi:hypothetical protein
MTSQPLDNLVSVNKLKVEPADQVEFEGLVKSGRARLRDAHNETLALESRFDLAYNASHALSLAALRWKGYRSDSRYSVFQCLPHTLGLEAKVWKVLDHCHHLRNRGEYEGLMDVNKQLVDDLIVAAEVVLAEVERLRDKKRS